MLAHEFPGLPSLKEVAVQEVVDICYRGNCQSLIKKKVGNILNVMKIRTLSSMYHLQQLCASYIKVDSTGEVFPMIN
jgi:hypothetical protein